MLINLDIEKAVKNQGHLDWYTELSRIMTVIEANAAKENILISMLRHDKANVFISMTNDKIKVLQIINEEVRIPVDYSVNLISPKVHVLVSALTQTILELDKLGEEASSYYITVKTDDKIDAIHSYFANLC